VVVGLSKCGHFLTRARPFLLVAAIAAILLPVFSLTVRADGPADVATGKGMVQRSLTAAQSGDLAGAKQQYQAYKDYWPTIENGVRAADLTNYRAIEARMRDVDAAFVPNPPDSSQIVAALTALSQSQSTFIAGQGGSQTAQTAASSGPGTAAAAPAAGPANDVTIGNGLVGRVLATAQSGDMANARQQYQVYKDYWPTIENGVRAADLTNYRAIEARMRDVDAAFVPNPPDSAQVVAALTALSQAQSTFIQGQGGSASASAPAASSSGATSTQPVLAPGASSASSTAAKNASIATLIQQLHSAQSAVNAGDYAEAAQQMKAFEDTWPDVEGQVKNRSASAYSQTEDDMGVAVGLLNSRSPEAKAVLTRMDVRLEPLDTHTQYGIFDATIIVLREGLEALLVLVALLAVLDRSGNADRRGWIWGGALAGIILSIAIGVGLNAALRGVINPGNRELIEGITGLVAATMLLYVSYWLHSNTSIKGWQNQIHQRTAQALTTGSLVGLAALAFVAVFREGAESVLFFLGMAADITMRDLVLGLAIGAGALVILGTLIVVLGVRIPMKPFFAVASVLVFYLCFKFLGTGIHSLQIAGVLPSTSVTYLPASDFLGISPTWQTTIPQVLLLVLAASVLLEGWVKQHHEESESPPAGAPAD
jgi:high-affinity iron transporter